jgi:hypothetical protein
MTMKAPNLFAVTASLLIVGASLFALRSSDESFASPVSPATTIHGLHVVDLAPIEVRPTAADHRAAALLETMPVAHATARLRHTAAEDAAVLIGSQLAMPYYSFGKVLSHGTKE